MKAKTNTMKLKIDKERCKGCILCVNVCPQHVLELTKEVNKKGCRYVNLKDPEKCTHCGLCAIICPDCAIEIIEEK
ncbi:MAG: 4Fe-4S dicluster domain-containing protein [Candidatus Omnitrophota bacterium]